MNRHFLYNRRALAFMAVAIMLMATIPLQASETPVSGRIVDGFRVLTVPDGDAPLQWTVYRGDYIRIAWPPTDGQALLKVSALGIQQTLTGNAKSDPYFKMKQTGQFAFTLGDREGILRVVDFRTTNYREMTAAQAADFASREKPLILDVRTPAEFKRGHLPHAVLIPVQELQRRISEVSAYREKDILIYCATGNRSTVASKILLDQGFTRITNMRYGIVDWQQRKYPVAN
jgi:rhodanese-related sulfurtransferase